MKYYVVADIHGYLTELREALGQAGFFDDEEPCKLIVCGDLLDRGGEAVELVDFMVELLDQGKLIYVEGNHEELLVSCLQEISRGGIYDIAAGMSVHYTNRTWDTLLQLSSMSELEAYGNPLELVSRIRSSPFYSRLLPAAVNWFETERYVFVHGWIPCAMEGYGFNASYEYLPDWREADTTAWRTARWHNGMELAFLHGITVPDKTVVCGHFHTSYGHAAINGVGTEWGEDACFEPFVGEGIIALDGCTAVSGRVNCIVIEDEEIA